MNNPHLFQMVKEAVDIEDAARRYGLEPDRSGWCRCPFHGEKTASFHLYRQRYMCFGCGASGDVIDLVAGIQSCGTMEAVRSLNQVMGLGIDLEAPVDTAELVKARMERAERERFKRWRREAEDTLTGRFRALHLARAYGGGADRELGVSDRYAAAVREIDKVEYYLDFVAYGAEEELRAARPLIDAVTARIRKGEAS